MYAGICVINILRVYARVFNILPYAQFALGKTETCTRRLCLQTKPVKLNKDKKKSNEQTLSRF